MLNTQIAHARVADRNGRAERVAATRQMLASGQPEKRPYRHRWRSRRIWSQAADRTPVQA